MPEHEGFDSDWWATVGGSPDWLPEDADTVEVPMLHDQVAIYHVHYVEGYGCTAHGYGFMSSDPAAYMAELIEQQDPCEHQAAVAWAFHAIYQDSPGKLYSAYVVDIHIAMLLLACPDRIRDVVTHMEDGHQMVIESFTSDPTGQHGSIAMARFKQKAIGDHDMDFDSLDDIDKFLGEIEEHLKNGEDK